MCVWLFVRVYVWLSDSVTVFCAGVGGGFEAKPWSNLSGEK